MKMKNDNKKVWVGVDQLTNDPAFQEAARVESKPLKSEKVLNTSANRRDFLKVLGFGVGAATIAAGCDIPIKKAIPYTMKPDSIVPGIATYYASSFVQGGDYCAVLVKTREGRPIKIEGNAFSKVTRGGTNARAQASVLSLYDTSRFQGPVKLSGKGIYGEDTVLTWKAIDKAIAEGINTNATIRIVSNTNLSPTSKQALADFMALHPKAEVITYDPISSAAMLEANQQSFGQQAIPSYHFDKARVIVSFDADFLGTWISPIEYAKDYIVNRKIKDVTKASMSRHIQVENHMTLTGSNADNRVLVKPSEQGAAILALYNAIAAAEGGVSATGPSLSADKAAKMKKVAKELLANRGHALVIAGSNNVGEQILVNAINDLLGSYGTTIDFTNASLQRQGLDSGIQNLIKEMKGGSVDALFIMDGANPAYDLPNSADFVAGMEKVSMKVSFSGAPNETASLCTYIAPTHHFLESWGDAEPKRGHYSLIQPTITPIFAAVGKEGTRQAAESLLIWGRTNKINSADDQPYLEYLKANWKTNMFSAQSRFSNFQSFWDSALHDGVFEIPQTDVAVVFAGDVNAAAGKINKPSNSELEISFFETVNAGNGQYANNPWLQELPDPVTRCAWGNNLTIPVTWDGGNEFSAYKGLNAMEIYSQADKVDVKVGEVTALTSVIRQFGQMEGTVGLAIGYGRTNTGKAGRALGQGIGVNVYPWLSIDANGNTQYFASNVNVSDKVETDEEFACVQYHHTMGVTVREENGEIRQDEERGEPFNVDEKTVMTLGEGFQGGLVDRTIIYRSNLKELPTLVDDIKHKRGVAEHLNSKSLYPYEEYKEKFYDQGHHWSMHIDLNGCIGCGTCQIACMAENNVPVVGKHEVHRHHEMSWIRIDRYFYGDYENPNAVYQPMICQHCDNAPCENVCPVNATNHSSEGLNQMIYNRCIGTRYCANNCPYKVRRFNWLDYTTADLFPINEPLVGDEDLPFGADNLTRMVLNPDVTVRSRGVIEKCSFCVQRIQEGKLTAKKEGRALRDEEVKTACQTACPTGAIIFGDDNRKDTKLAEAMDNPLNYYVLEEIDVRPSVMYKAKINNRNEDLDV